MFFLKKIQVYLFLVLAIFLICLVIFKPWSHPLTLPYAYWSDAYFHQMFIKNQLTSGKFWYSNQLSLPGEQSLLDFPIVEVGLQGIVFLLSFLTKNHFIIFNLFFLSSFFLNGITAFFVLKQLRFNQIFSFWGALIFSFLPYHFAHGAIHLSLSHYFVVPLAFLVSSWILFNQKIKHQNWLAILIGALVGLTGIYYAYFSCLLIIFSSLVSGIQKKITKKNLFLSFLFISTVSLVVLLQLLPNFKFWAEHGKNQAIGQRVPAEAVLHSLKLRQLIIPLHDYNLSFLKEFTHTYKENPAWDMENRQYLGLVGILGVFICVLIFFEIKVFGSGKMIQGAKDSFSKMKNWYFIFVLLVLVSMSYGGASLIAHLITPQIRAYGRIVPFLNFVLIMIFLLFIQNWQKKIKSKKIFWLVFNLIFYLSLLDSLQAYNPIQAELITDFYSDQKFVGQIETKLDKGSAIYQLPYKDFPETPDLYKLRDYELFKGYLHSKDLKWSYGSLNGRIVASWQRDLSAKLPEEQLVLIKSKNFKGLYLDTYGYQDGGKAVIASFSAMLKQKPLVSDNSRLVFFDLRKFK